MWHLVRGRPRRRLRDGPGSDWLAVHAFTIYPGLQSEARGSLYLLAAGVPFLTASSAARGFLEGHQRFGWVNIVRSPLGVLTYVGPVLVLPFSNSVTLGVGVIVLARVVACVVYVMMGWALLPKVRTRALLNAADARELVSSGAWITSANIVASATAYLDRLLVGAVVSIEALAYYATPQEVIGRVTILPATVAAVMFPAFGAAWAQPSGALTRLFEKTSFYSHLAMFPITFVGAVFAPQWLSFWMGPAFAERSAIVTQIFLPRCLPQLSGGHAVQPAAGSWPGRPDCQAPGLPAPAVSHCTVVCQCLVRYHRHGGGLGRPRVDQRGRALCGIVRAPPEPSRRDEAAGSRLGGGVRRIRARHDRVGDAVDGLRLHNCLDLVHRLAQEADRAAGLEGRSCAGDGRRWIAATLKPFPGRCPRYNANPRDQLLDPLSGHYHRQLEHRTAAARVPAVDRRNGSQRARHRPRRGGRQRIHRWFGRCTGTRRSAVDRSAQPGQPGICRRM